MSAPIQCLMVKSMVFTIFSWLNQKFLNHAWLLNHIAVNAQSSHTCVGILVDKCLYESVRYPKKHRQRFRELRAFVQGAPGVFIAGLFGVLAPLNLV